MPFPYCDEIKNLNDATREATGGSFIQIPNGVTHYELANDSLLLQEDGQDDRDAVIFVHGFSVPYFIFDPTFEFLRISGFRTLRYDLFGRGFSDRPRTRYNMDFFVGQLHDLLDALHFTNPVNLIGLSMGGPIVATFTVRCPHRVKSLTLIDPSGAKPVTLNPMLKLAKVPIVAETIFGWMGTERMIKSAVDDFFDPSLVDRIIDKYRVQMHYRGFMSALLSSVRNNMLHSFVETYEQVGKMNKPILLIWGRDDATVPIEHSEDLRAAMPNVEFHIIENCGHVPHYERPDEVNPILLRFLETAELIKIPPVELGIS